MKALNKYSIFLSFLLIISCKAKKDNPIKEIGQTINQWEKSQIDKGIFCKECPDFSKMPSVDSVPENQKSKYYLHKIDSSNYEINYSDINGDSTLDAFVMYAPDPCYFGSSIEMYSHFKYLLILSNKDDGYNIDTTTIPQIKEKIENNFKTEFADGLDDGLYEIDLEKLDNNGFSGTLRVQTKQDNCHACTSLVGDFSYNKIDKKISVNYYYKDQNDIKHKIKETEISYITHIYERN